MFIYRSSLVIERKKVLCVVGTRPEVIKMVPIIRALRSSNWVKCVVVVTAQHRDLLDQMLMQFNIEVDYDLNLMKANQGLTTILARMLPALEEIIRKEQPYAMLAQGNTVAVFGAALSVFHAHIPFGHVEAGLRTYNLEQPFPEEGYRQMVARITHWHFAPTEAAADALLQESIDSKKIYVVGNTCIDTLLQTVAAHLVPPSIKTQRTILLTAHRRENFGEPLKNIFTAVLAILKQYPDIHILYPVRPNPNVRQLAYSMLESHFRIELVEPLDYFDFVSAMRSAYLIMTDSGGVQEEAPASGKLVLVLRETTERPEPVKEGVAKLIGTEVQDIVLNVKLLLDDVENYQCMAKVHMPYGDGEARRLICRVLNYG